MRVKREGANRTKNARIEKPFTNINIVVSTSIDTLFPMTNSTENQSKIFIDALVISLTKRYKEVAANCYCGSYFLEIGKSNYWHD